MIRAASPGLGRVAAAHPAPAGPPLYGPPPYRPPRYAEPLRVRPPRTGMRPGTAAGEVQAPF